MAYIKTMLKKFFGNMDDVSNEEEHIYPVTSTEAVFDKNNNTLDSIIASVKNSLKTISSDLSQLTLRVDNISKPSSDSKNIWDGSIVEIFYDTVNPNSSDIITGTSIVNGTVVWDWNRHTFYNMVIENGQPKYYRGWVGDEKYLRDNIPHSKIYKMNDVLYYYNTELKDLVLLNSKEYLRVNSIIESATVMWYKNWPLGDPDFTELTKVVYIQNPQSSNADSTFSGPVFALVNDVGNYLIPYEKFDSTILVKYQDKEGNIIDGLEVSCNGDVYKYNSNTKTLERV